MTIPRALGPSALVLLLSGACAPPARPPAPVAVSPIDTMALRAHTFFLSDDLLLGRGTGTWGADVAALYIEAQCRRLGLRPVGGGYAHPVPLEQVTPRPDATYLEIGTERLAVGRDFLVTGGTASALEGFSGRAVFVGTGAEIRRAPEALPALDGEVALVGGVLRADEARQLARRGAVGIAQVVDDSTTYALYVASRGTGLTVIAEAGVPSSFYADVPSVLIGPTGLDALRQPDAHVTLTVAYARQPLRATNVACLLPGTDAARRDTAIVFTAHYDHLGVSVPDARGDSVYNGFSDDAAGVAMLLAIASALEHRPNHGLRYGTLFLFFTGEERGLLGSDYFVAHPPLPTGRMRALINLDAGAPPARPWTWRLAGGEGNPLGDLASDVAEARGWSATRSPATPNSDYFPFARVGVPAVFIVPGPAPYEGLSADSSQALRRRWDHYHAPSDEYDDAFPFVGLQRYAEYALRIAEAVDGGGRPPR